MGEWTWLHVYFPIADIELVAPPIQPKDANVLVRTVRRLPAEDHQPESYQVRVAPHNVAPFRGGPWLHNFTADQLESPGPELTQFRENLAREVEKAKSRDS